MNRPVHFEIHAADPAKIQKFYTEMFGWEFNAAPGIPNYWLITSGPEKEPGINGGMLKRGESEEQKGTWVNAFVCTMEVKNMDKLLEKATKLGGTIAMPKGAIPGMGAWVAYCKDPDGAVFGLIEYDKNAK